MKSMKAQLKFQNALDKLLSEDSTIKQKHLDAYLTSESDSGESLLDEEYYKNQPPPIEYKAIGDKIVKIVPVVQESTGDKKKRKKKKKNSNGVSTPESQPQPSTSISVQSHIATSSTFSCPVLDEDSASSSKIIKPEELSNAVEQKNWSSLTSFQSGKNLSTSNTLHQATLRSGLQITSKYQSGLLHDCSLSTKSEPLLSASSEDTVPCSSKSTTLQMHNSKKKLVTPEPLKYKDEQNKLLSAIQITGAQANQYLSFSNINLIHAGLQKVLDVLAAHDAIMKNNTNISQANVYIPASLFSLDLNNKVVGDSTVQIINDAFSDDLLIKNIIQKRTDVSLQKTEISHNFFPVQELKLVKGQQQNVNGCDSEQQQIVKCSAAVQGKSNTIPKIDELKNNSISNCSVIKDTIQTEKSVSCVPLQQYQPAKQNVKSENETTESSGPLQSVEEHSELNDELQDQMKSKSGAYRTPMQRRRDNIINSYFPSDSWYFWYKENFTNFRRFQGFYLLGNIADTSKLMSIMNRRRVVQVQNTEECLETGSENYELKENTEHVINSYSSTSCWYLQYKGDNFSTFCKFRTGYLDTCVEDMKGNGDTVTTVIKDEENGLESQDNLSDTEKLISIPRSHKDEYLDTKLTSEGLKMNCNIKNCWYFSYKGDSFHKYCSFRDTYLDSCIQSVENGNNS